jgi:hypothetical protein
MCQDPHALDMLGVSFDLFKVVTSAEEILPAIEARNSVTPLSSGSLTCQPLASKTRQDSRVPDRTNVKLSRAPASVYPTRARCSDIGVQDFGDASESSGSTVHQAEA